MVGIDMEYFNTVSLIISFLGGGIISALINWVRANNADKKDREVRFLDDQIRKLYGPLYYLVSQSEILFQLSDDLHEAYDKEYVGKNWSMDQFTQKALEEETTTTMETANKYIRMVEKNNDKMKEVLDNNFPLLDPDDIDIIMVFFKHHIRLNIERDTDGKTTTPHRIYNQLEGISFLRPEVIKRIKTKFYNKKQKLENLLKRINI